MEDSENPNRRKLTSIRYYNQVENGREFDSECHLTEQERSVLDSAVSRLAKQGFHLGIDISISWIKK
jgi:hypothetical protein